MEPVVAVALGGRGVGIAGAAPVVIQIAFDPVCVDHQLFGVGFVSGDLAVQVIVLGVKAVGGIEAGGPLVDIINCIAAGFGPFTGAGDQIPIAVQGLALKVAAAHAVGDGIQPLLSQRIGCDGVGIAAIRAGHGIDCIAATGGSGLQRTDIAVRAFKRRCFVAQRHGAVGIFREGEGDLPVAGNEQLFVSTFDEGADGVGAVAF